MKRRTKVFTVPVDEVDLGMIRMLAEREDLPMASMVRKMVQTKYAEIFGDKKPRVPSGS